MSHAEELLWSPTDTGVINGAPTSAAGGGIAFSIDPTLPPPPLASSPRGSRGSAPSVKRPIDFAARTYATMAVSLVWPTSVCMFVLAWAVQSLVSIPSAYTTAAFTAAAASSASTSDPLFVVAGESSGGSAASNLGSALINTLIVIGAITAMTFLMVLLYKCGCAKVLYGWLFLSATLIFFFMFWVWVDVVATRYQIPYDYPSMALVVWNFGVVGLATLFHRGPPALNQGYHIILSIIVAWGLAQVPEWTTWCLLVGVAIYDIVAVLCPKGPLNLLVRAAEERNEPIPGFIYDSDSRASGLDVIHADLNRQHREQQQQQQSRGRNGGSSSGRSGSSGRGSATPPATPAPGQPRRSSGESAEPPRNSATHHTQPQPQSSQQESANRRRGAARRRGQDGEGDDDAPLDPFEAAEFAQPFKLGLGDFIFYSLLVARAAMGSSGSQAPWLVCYMTVESGMLLTLAALLFLRDKVPALPALPFSIFMATIAYLMVRFVTESYWDMLAFSSLGF